MRYFLVSVLLLGLFLSCNEQEKEVKVDLNDNAAKTSYAIGLTVGKYYKDADVEWDAKIIAKGFQDAATGATTAIEENEVRALMQELEKNMRQKHQQKMMELSQKNKDEGDAFLAENKTKEGVVTTESGLQYKVLTEGNGPKPKDTDQVKVHYRGRLLDGTEFDSSYKRNQPATFQVKGVIPGWIEALQLMPVGSKWELYIPSNLAYGPRPPRGSSITPNATLIFEVELLEIVK